MTTTTMTVTINAAFIHMIISYLGESESSANEMFQLLSNRRHMGSDDCVEEKSKNAQ